MGAFDDLIPGKQAANAFSDLIPKDKPYNAAADTPPGELQMINIGAGLHKLVDFVKQVSGNGPSDAEIHETRARDEQLAAQTPYLGKANQILGESLPFLAAPAGGLVRAARGAMGLPEVVSGLGKTLSVAADSGAVGAASGAAQPVTSEESRGKNAAIGGVAGAVIPGAVGGAMVVSKAIRDLLTKGGASEKAMAELAKVVTPEDLSAIRQHLSAGSDIPLTAAEITQSPALGALERQANTKDPAGAANMVAQQARARYQALQDATAGADKIEASEFARDAATEPMRSSALAKAKETPYFFAPVLEKAQAMRSGAAGADPAVQKLVGYVENELALTPAATKVGEEVPSIYKTIDKAVVDAPQSSIQKTIEQAASEMPQHGYGSNVPAPHMTVPDSVGPSSKATPERLYTVRKVLLDKLNGPAQLGDELSAAAKGRRADVMKLVDSIDGALDDATGGVWSKYLDEYGNKSKEVNSNQAQQLIRDAFDGPGAPQMAGVSQITGAKLGRTIAKYGENRFGPTLDPDAAQALQALQENIGKTEGIQKLVKSGGTSGGGSNTAMDLMSDIAQPRLAENVWGLKHTLGPILARSDRMTQAAMTDALRNPEVFIAGVSKRLKANQPLSPSQDAILRMIRGATAALPASVGAQ